MAREPGIYEIPAAEYHADPALGHSGAVTLMDCPARFHHELTAPDENSREFDIGTATHLLVLERDKFASAIVEIDDVSYRKKAAQDLRDEAYAAGKVPLLPQHMKVVEDMRAAIMRHPVAGRMFQGGRAELSLFWQDAATGIDRKARLDYLVADESPGALIVDLKTCASAHPFAAERAAYRNHWWSQEAWYSAAVQAVLGCHAASMLFVAVEQKAPHLVVVYQLEPAAVGWGEMHNAKACEIFARCRRTGRWPGYADEVQLLNLPSFSEFELQRRHANEEFAVKPTAADLARGNAMLAP